MRYILFLLLLVFLVGSTGCRFSETFGSVPSDSKMSGEPPVVTTTTTTTIAIDPFQSSVSLLMSMDGINDSTTFSDTSSAANSFSPVGTVTISTSKSISNGSSAYFADGSSYLLTNNIPNFTFDKAFTIEAWANFSDPSKSNLIVQSAKTIWGTTNYGFGVLHDSGRNLHGIGFYLGVYGSNCVALTTSYIPPADEWHHYAVTRDSFNRWRLFIDGVVTVFTLHEENITFNTGINIQPSQGEVTIGAGVRGYVDDLRITKGVARYTSNFIPGVNFSRDISFSTTSTLPINNGACSTACGALGNSCYDNAQAKSAFCATLQDGNEYSAAPTTLEYVKAEPSCSSNCFYVWRERDIAQNQTARRILNAAGLWDNNQNHLQWQQILNRNGMGYLATLTAETLKTGSNTTVVSQLGGRACPTNVFINYTNMVENNRCLYYDSGNAAQALNKDSGIESEDYLNAWNSNNTGRTTFSSYYEGNIRTCADKGMRLPTLYETKVSVFGHPLIPSIPSGDLIINGLTLNRQPHFFGSSNGVPSLNGLTWTASAQAAGANNYFLWNGVSRSNSTSYTASYYVRCVLP